MRRKEERQSIDGNAHQRFARTLRAPQTAEDLPEMKKRISSNPSLGGKEELDEPEPSGYDSGPDTFE
jgi:hypothetical protein